jgi:hypothetical protein
LTYYGSPAVPETNHETSEDSARAATFAIVMIYIRSIYRTIELSQGWTGYLITHELYFIVLDAVTMFLCGVIFNIVHPGWFLPPSLQATKDDEVHQNITTA